MAEYPLTRKGKIRYRNGRLPDGQADITSLEGGRGYEAYIDGHHGSCYRSDIQRSFIRW